MLGQKIKSPSNTFKTQISTPEDDPSRLTYRMQLISSEYEQSYQDHLVESSQISKSSSASRILFNSELNKLLFKNSEKLKQLEDLKKELKTISSASSKIQYNQKFSLESSLFNTLTCVESSEKEQNSIKVMLSREKEAILNIKEKVQQLGEDHRKLTKSYNESKFAKEKACYNLILVNNEIVKAKKEEVMNNKLFENSVKDQKKVKAGYEKEKLRIIEEMSKKFVNIEMNEEKSVRNKEEFQKTLKFIEEFQKSRQQDLCHLNDYRHQISTINKIISKYSMPTINPPKSSGPGTSAKIKKSIECIIKAYDYLQYNSESLELQFSILTSENSLKSKELAHYSTKLKKLKNENDLIFQYKQNSPCNTFNLTKQKLENSQFLTAKFESGQKTEENVLKFFFELLLTLEKSLKKLEYCSKNEEKPFSKYITTQISLLDSLKAELYSQPIQAKAEDRKSIRGLELKSSSQSLSAYKPVALAKHNLGLLTDEKFESFYSFYKKQQMLQFFVSIEELGKYFKAFKDPKDLYLNIDSLLLTAHSRYRKFYARLMTMLNELINKTKLEVKLTRQSGVMFLSQESLRVKESGKSSKRTSFRYPQFKGFRGKHENFEDSDTQIEMFETVKNKEKNGGVEVNESNLKELKSPQAVLKEVLKIEKKIKDLRFRERIAGRRDGLGKCESKINLNQPWAARTMRPFSHEKYIKESRFQLYTPRSKKLEIKV